MENFGGYLKSQREKKGIRLEEIASITKIHLHSLELLEASQWQHLPPEPFIRGFITAYAKYVGLDPKEVLLQYSNEIEIDGGQSHSSAESQPLPTPAVDEKITPDAVIQQTRSGTLIKSGAVMGALAVMALVGAIIYHGMPKHEPKAVAPLQADAKTGKEAEETPSLVSGNVAETAQVAVPKESPLPIAADGKTAPAPAVAEAVTPPPAIVPELTARTTASPITAAPAKIEPNENTAANSNSHEVVIQAKERTWIKVVTDDKKPVELFLSPGESKTYSANTKIKIMLGNSAGSVVTHNGKVDEGVKYDGTIRSYIYPAGARFPQDPGSRRNTAAKVEKDEPAEGSEETPQPPAAAEPLPFDNSAGSPSVIE